MLFYGHIEHGLFSWDHGHSPELPTTSAQMEPLDLSNALCSIGAWHDDGGLQLSPVAPVPARWGSLSGSERCLDQKQSAKHPRGLVPETSVRAVEGFLPKFKWLSFPLLIP